MAVSCLLDGQRLPWARDMLAGGVVALEVRTGLWGIAQGPLTGARQWLSRAFCGFDAATGVTLLMPTLPLLFASSAQAEGTSAGITPIVELSHPSSHLAIDSGEPASRQACQAH